MMDVGGGKMVSPKIDVGGWRAPPMIDVGGGRMVSPKSDVGGRRAPPMIDVAGGRSVSPTILVRAGFGTTCPREFVIEAGIPDSTAAVNPEAMLPSESVTIGTIGTTGATAVLDAAAVCGITFPFASVAGVTGAATVCDGFAPPSVVSTTPPTLLTAVVAAPPILLSRVLTTPPTSLTAVVTAPPILLSRVLTTPPTSLTAVVTAPPILLSSVLTPPVTSLTAVVTAPPTLLARVLTPPVKSLTAVLRSPGTLLASVSARGTTIPFASMVELDATCGPNAFVKAVYRSVPVGTGVSGLDDESPNCAPAFEVAGMPVSVAEVPFGAPVSVAVAAGSLGCETPGKAGTVGILNVAPTIGMAPGGAV